MLTCKDEYHPQHQIIILTVLVDCRGIHEQYWSNKLNLQSRRYSKKDNPEITSESEFINLNRSESDGLYIIDEMLLSTLYVLRLALNQNYKLDICYLFGNECSIYAESDSTTEFKMSNLIDEFKPEEIKDVISKLTRKSHGRIAEYSDTFELLILLLRVTPFCTRAKSSSHYSSRLHIKMKIHASPACCIKETEVLCHKRL